LWGGIWDTKDDVLEVLNGRFAAYNRLAQVTGRADPDNMSLLVGLLCAVMIRGDRGVFSDDINTAGTSFGNAVVGLLEGDDLALTTAATGFRTRFDAVSELLVRLGD